MSRSLSDPVELPCGITLSNRVLKAALAEQMARTADHSPDEQFEIAYRTWSTGNWGAILTGNVQIDEQYLGAPNDVSLSGDLSSESVKQRWRKYALAMQSHGTPGIVQINHPGRKSPLGAGTRSFWQKDIAPSALRLDIAREAFFIDFAHAVRKAYPNIVLMLTGGFRTRSGMQAAIDENACDLIGLGRVSVIEPKWPRRNLDTKTVSDEQAQLWLESVDPGWVMRNLPVKALLAEAESDYYARQIRRLGRGLDPIAPPHRL